MLAGENRPHGMSDGKTCCRKKPDGEGGQVVRMEAGVGVSGECLMGLYKDPEFQPERDGSSKGLNRASPGLLATIHRTDCEGTAGDVLGEGRGEWQQGQAEGMGWIPDSWSQQDLVTVRWGARAERSPG